jgi:hypothetical protein
MKKAIQFAICILAALLAVEPSLAAVDCGQRLHCAAGVCSGCCGHMAGMPAAMNAMNCARSDPGMAMAAASDSPSILGQRLSWRESRCGGFVEESPQYAGAAPRMGDVVVLASAWGEPVTPAPGSAFLPRDGEPQDAGPPRYVLFRVFRI